MVKWFEQRFLDGSYGYCATFQSVLTGKECRQAVRALNPGASSQETRSQAKAMLQAWGSDLNTDPAFAAAAVQSYDDVLEGAEPFKL